MITLAPYVHFADCCEDAFAFYAACGLGQVTELMRFRDGPMAERAGPERADKVMHAEFRGPALVLMGSDMGKSRVIEGMALALATTDLEAGRRLCGALSAGGEILHSFQKEFWGAHFGMVRDKFGVTWNINCEPAAA